jgi:hypothetical protein
MKKRLAVFLAIAVFLCASGMAETKKSDFKNRFGMMCGIELVKPVTNAGDGVIAGVGLKYWLLEPFALKSVLFFNYLNVRATNQNTVNFGMSAACEYHFITGPVSPYAGALAGIEILSDSTATAADYHLGGIFGVELSPLDFLSLYVEYSLTATFRETGTEVDLGKNHLPTFGAVFYFN